MARKSKQEVFDKADVQIWCHSSRLIGCNNNDIYLPSLRKHINPKLHINGETTPDLYSAENITGDQLFDFLVNGPRQTTYMDYGQRILYDISPLEILLLSSRGYINIGGISFTYMSYNNLAQLLSQYFAEICKTKFFSADQIKYIDDLMWVSSYSHSNPLKFYQTLYRNSPSYIDSLRKPLMYEYHTIRKYTDPFFVTHKYTRPIKIVNNDIITLCDENVQRPTMKGEVLHTSIRYLDKHDISPIEDIDPNHKYTRKCNNCNKIVYIGINDIFRDTLDWGHNSPPDNIEELVLDDF